MNDEYWFKRCLEVAENATCLRRKVGAVLVSNEGREIAIGYNGSPTGESHCVDVGCLIGTCSEGCLTQHGGHCYRTVHAEVNAIAYAAKFGRSTENALLYATITPCRLCSGVIKNAGIYDIRVLEEIDKYKWQPSCLK